MFKPLRRALLNYFIALSMNAGMATPLAWTPSLDGPPPIVRRYWQPGTGHLDPREVVSVGAASAVVTNPLTSSSSIPATVIHDN